MKINSVFKSTENNVNYLSRCIVVIFLSYPRRSYDHACPVGQHHIRVILKAPADGAVAHALLTGLKLLQQAKITRYNSCGRRTAH